MFPKFRELKKIEEQTGHKRIHGSLQGHSLRSVVVEINCDECKQAITLPEGTYCGIWREKTSRALCKSCPHFDRELPEYKLFRRT